MFEEMVTDSGTCFPIHVVVFVSLLVSFWTQNVSESIIAQFLRIFVDFCT